MFGMKKWIVSMATAMMIFGSSAAHAGIPVVDIPALVSLVQQVLSWIEQYGQMVEELEQLEAQYNQAVQQYESLTGSRGLGSLLNNSELRKVVPDDLVATYDALNTGGYGGLSSAAKTLRDASKLYNCEDRTGVEQTNCEASFGINSQDQANIGSALDWTKKRGDNVEGLQSKIDATDDPKAIAELQARIAAEQAQIANDANRIALKNANADTANRAAKQRIQEQEIDQLLHGTRSLAAMTSFLE